MQTSNINSNEIYNSSKLEKRKKSTTEWNGRSSSLESKHVPKRFCGTRSPIPLEKASALMKKTLVTVSADNEVLEIEEQPQTAADGLIKLETRSPVPLEEASASMKGIFVTILADKEIREIQERARTAADGLAKLLGHVFLEPAAIRPEDLLFAGLKTLKQHAQVLIGEKITKVEREGASRELNLFLSLLETTVKFPQVKDLMREFLLGVFRNDDNSDTKEELMDEALEWIGDFEINSGIDEADWIIQLSVEANNYHFASQCALVKSLKLTTVDWNSEKFGTALTSWKEFCKLSKKAKGLNEDSGVTAKEILEGTFLDEEMVELWQQLERSADEKLISLHEALREIEPKKDLLDFSLLYWNTFNRKEQFLTILKETATSPQDYVEEGVEYNQNPSTILEKISEFKLYKENKAEIDGYFN